MDLDGMNIYDTVDQQVYQMICAINQDCMIPHEQKRKMKKILKKERIGNLDLTEDLETLMIVLKKRLDFRQLLLNPKLKKKMDCAISVYSKV